MNRNILILIISIYGLCLDAQPLMQSELGWGNNCTGTAYSGAQYYIMIENSSLTNFLIGGGNSPLFSIKTLPLSGTTMFLNSLTGSNYYMPNNNFTGNDQFQYTVSCASCLKVNATGTVVISIQPTNVSSCISFYLTNGGGQNEDIDIACLPNGNADVVFTFVMGPLTVGGPTLLDTNRNWEFIVTDTDNYVNPNTAWFHIVGQSLLTWTPAISTGASPPTAFFGVLMSNCPPLGDIITGMFCTNYCPNTATNSNVLVVENTPTGLTLLGGPTGAVFSINTGPYHGSTSGFNASTGNLTYTPMTSYLGTDQIAFSVSLGGVCSTSAVENITVSCNDADADNFLSRASITDVTTANAICGLVTSLKASNIWNTLTICYPLVGTNSNAQSQNLISSSYPMIWVGSWSFNVNGATTTANTNTYGDTGYLSSNLSYTNGAVFVNLKSYSASGYWFYAQSSSFSTLYIGEDGTPEIISDYYGVGTNKSGSYTGFMGVCATNSTGMTMAYGGIQIFVSGPTQAYTGGQDIALGGVIGSPLYTSPAATYDFMCIGTGLSSTQITALQNIVATFESAMGR